MNVIVQDNGFVSDDWSGPLLDWDVTTQGGGDPETGYGLDVPNTVTAEQLKPYFNSVAMIRVSFPNSADGRGFSIARTLRLMGYTGRLRAHGLWNMPDTFQACTTSVLRLHSWRVAGGPETAHASSHFLDQNV